MQRLAETNVAHMRRLFYGRHSVENLLAEESHAFVLVDGEIADTETGEVLEEVSALTRIHTVVLQLQ